MRWFNPLGRVQELMRLLDNGKVNPNTILEELKEMRTRKLTYNSRYWREKREQLIGKSCQACGTKNGPFVLQHLWHPIPIGTLQYKAYQRYPTSDPPYYSDYFNSGGGDYEDYQIFLHDFGKHKWESFLKDNEAQLSIAKQALDEEIRYLNLGDTETWCSKCAYYWDMRGESSICPICKSRYTYGHCPTCKECKYTEAGAPLWGLVQCHVCKVEYHDPKYPTCFTCHLFGEEAAR